MRFYSSKPVTREMWSLHNGPFVRKIQSRNPSGDWHWARPFPESSALCIHQSGVLSNFPSPHPPFPGLQRVRLGTERGGLLGRNKGGTEKGVSLSNTAPAGERDEGGGPGNWLHGSKAQRWPERGKDLREDIVVTAQRKRTLVPPRAQVWSMGCAVSGRNKLGNVSETLVF